MSGNKQASEGIAQYFTYPSEARNGQRVTSTFGITYEFRVDPKSGRGGWFEVGATPTATYIFNIGLTEAPPGTVNLDPAKPAPGEIGGINEPPANGIQHTRSYSGTTGVWSPVAAGGLTFDTGLTLTGTSVSLDPAKPPGGEIGGINEPPPDTGFQYTRSYVAGAGIWTQTSAAGYIWGVALTENPTGTINVDPATNLIIGAITEPPIDAFNYVRNYSGGVGKWVQTTGGTYTWGIGLAENPVGSFNIDLLPASAVELGGVTVQARTLTQGLLLVPSGDLSAPLATDLLAGSIVEPAPDNLTYARKRDLAGVSSWVVTTAVFVGDLPPPAPLSQGQLWFESDTGRLHLYYTDANSSQWVQVGGP